MVELRAFVVPVVASEAVAAPSRLADALFLALPASPEEPLMRLFVPTLVIRGVAPPVDTAQTIVLPLPVTEMTFALSTRTAFSFPLIATASQFCKVSLLRFPLMAALPPAQSFV